MATKQLAGALTALLALTISGCHKSPTTSPSIPEDKLQYTYRWISNPRLDLMSSEGTFVRAVTESEESARLSHQSGRAAFIDKGYPGIERAEKNVFGKRDLGYFGGDTSQPSIVGTAYYEVVDFRRDGESFTATVCNYSGQTAQKEPNGKYSSRGSTPTGSASTYTFGPDPSMPLTEQHAPPTKQHGPARQPDDNVFGTWLLLEEPRSAADQVEMCQKLAPGTPADWPDVYVRSDPPPTLPPDPGWPAGSSA
ncbi:Uncharacterised protein [Mycobacteroides abscessus subsp. bolletii]|nr:Uncharacterised protein [Mycobacteroides abscessus subsp. bolletii]